MNKLLYKILGKILNINLVFFSKHFKILFSLYIYNKLTGKILNLRNPKNFNEKLMWLKLYYNNPLIIKCTDKYLVREYIEEKGLSNILNKLYDIYSSIEEIDFEKLPNQFVLKANHGAQYNIICKNKSLLDIEKTKNTLDNWLNSVYGLEYGEWHYSKITPKIICEKYLQPIKGATSIVDYKIHCFNGRPYCFLVAYDRTSKSKKLSSYDLQWKRISLLKEEGKEEFTRPKTLDDMILSATILSKPFPYVRVDFYEINDKLYFGELTFTPHGGIMISYKEEALEIMGTQLILPEKTIFRI